MKKFFLRIGAFALDTIIVVVISALICRITFINPKGKELLNKQDALYNETELAKDLKKKTESYVKDNKINKFENKEILDDFPNYYELFKDVVIDEELSDDFKNNIQNKITEKYTQTANDLSYEISKLSLNETIICFIVYLAYFGLIPFFTKGQTLAKKLLRLKVVDSKNEEKAIPLWKYLLRAFLICELIFVIINTIMLYTMTKKAFINATFWLNEAKYLYEIAFLICLVIREDQKSIHDLLLGTEVIHIDKEGNKIPDPIYTLPNTSKEVKEVEEAKEVKTTKKTPKKATSVKKKKTKEEVKAEKVND